MEKNYSMLKIIKNKVGYLSAILLFIGIVLFIISLIFINSLGIKIQLLLYSTIIILFILVLSIKHIIKIIHLFKNGIETKAFVIDDHYMLPPMGNYMALSLMSKTLSPWNDVEKYKKDGVIFRYKIDSETYENKYCYIINGDTMFIRQDSVINILVSPKNKNDAIIKDIFSKY
jgi:hypothetical protein